jgi:outer membrane receptor protein involved in Fe transport
VTTSAPPPAVPAPPPPGLPAAAGPSAPPPEVIVHAARLPDAAGDAAYAIKALDHEALQVGRGLDEALLANPSFSLYRRTSSLGANPTTQGVSLRAIAGSGASRALVTLDGAPQNDPFGGWVIWTALPAIAVADARIIRGAGSGPYGAGALTGVVALDSVDPSRGAAADASLGDLGYRRLEGLEGWQAGPLALLADGGALHSDGWIPVRAGRGAADRPLSLDAESGALSARADVADSVLAARAAVYAENRGAGEVGAGSRASGGQASLALTRQPSEARPGLRLEAWGDVSELANTSATIAQGRNAITPADDQYATPAFGAGANAAVRWTPPDASIELGADVRAATGESRERYAWVANAFTKGRKAGGESLVGGLYLEGSKRVGAAVFTAGVRVDEWADLASERVENVLASGQTSLDQKIPDRSGTVPTGRLGVERPLLAGLTWRAAAYSGFRPATLNELHRPYRVGNNDTEANPTLTPERLFGAETGLEVRSGGFKAAADVFVNQLQNAITNVTIGAGPATFPVAGFIAAGGVLYMRENAGTVNADGLEAEASHALLGDALTLEAALAVTRSRVDGGSEAPQLTGKRPALTPGQTATFGLRARPLPRFQMSLAMRHQSAAFEDDLNTLRLGAATTIDAGADLAIRPNLSLYLRADNLLNAAVQTQETVNHILSYGPPLMVRIGVRFTP